jgi:hypothetical protein
VRNLWNRDRFTAVLGALLATSTLVAVTSEASRIVFIVATDSSLKLSGFQFPETRSLESEHRLAEVIGEMVRAAQ